MIKPFADSPAPLRQHILTVVLEDYYHVSPFKHLIQRGEWGRFERRLEVGTRRTLDLLDEFGLRATFFVLGWVADNAPELVRLVADRGHEISSKGYYHRGIGQMTPAEFREDLARAREALQRASRQKVLGYRVGERWFAPEDLWALDVLAETGYAYDSSIKPVLRTWARDPSRRFIHRHRAAAGEIWEFPVSSLDVLGMHVPISGGNYLRQFPRSLVRRALTHWDRVHHTPFVMYFHTWELDPDQPKISAASFLAQLRQYRNLGKVDGMLREYFSRYRFQSIADHLQLDVQAEAETEHRFVDGGTRLIPASSETPSEQIPVSIVIPCYNEELVLPYLLNTLQQLEHDLENRFQIHFIFIDDGSSDGTAADLGRLIAGRARHIVLRHDRNRGVAAAILTGLRHATTEIVCSIDSDCTYDPSELQVMIPLLGNDVDLVTASPYHPQGAVRNVPGWRLSLSRSASALYRLALHQKIHTFTSCFRVYRRSTMMDLDLREPGFLGIAELIGRLDLAGGRVVEHPTTLHVRMLGRSKMKVVRTIFGHLRLLTRLALSRLLGHPAQIAGRTPVSQQLQIGNVSSHCK